MKEQNKTNRDITLLKSEYDYLKEFEILTKANHEFEIYTDYNYNYPRVRTKLVVSRIDVNKELRESNEKLRDSILKLNSDIDKLKVKLKEKSFLNKLKFWK